MSATFQPYGLRQTGNTQSPGGIEPELNTITSGYNTAIGYGTPVYYTNSGVLAVALNTPTKVDGIFIGWRPQSGASNGAITNIPLNNWVAGTTYTGNIIVFVQRFDKDPDGRFQVQANGTIPASAIGSGVNLAASGGVNGVGMSLASVSNSLLTSGTAQFQITGLAPSSVATNAFGDAFTEVEVKPIFTGFTAQVTPF